MVVFGLSVSLSWYPMWIVDAAVAVTVLRVCMLRECECARVTGMLVWGMDEVWLR